MDARLVQMSSGHSFLEAPRWRQGALYASDFFTDTILRWDGDGAPSIVCEIEGQPSGLGWTPDGDLLIVSMQQSKGGCPDRRGTSVTILTGLTVTR